MSYTSEQIIDYVKGCVEQPTVRDVANAMGVVDPIEYRRLKDRLHGMVKCGILGATKIPGVKKVTFTFLREKIPTTNPFGLTRKQARQLNSERYNRKIGMVPRTEYLASITKDKPVFKHMTIKSEPKVNTEVEFESVESWMKRTGQTPEILPGLRMI